MMVLGIILAVFIVLLVLPVGVGVAYDDQAGPQVRLLAGPVKILVYPRKKKEHPKKKSKKKAQPKPEQEPKPQEQPKKSSFTVQDCLAFLRLFSDMTASLKRKLVLEVLTVHVTFGGKDAASIALNYGRAWALIGILTPVIENNFSVKSRDIQAFCDYTEEKMGIEVLFAVRMRIGQMMALGIRAGIELLKIMKEKKRRCSNESSSS